MKNLNVKKNKLKRKLVKLLNSVSSSSSSDSDTSLSTSNSSPRISPQKRRRRIISSSSSESEPEVLESSNVCPDYLSLLGDHPDSSNPKGIRINKELAVRWSKYLTEGLKADAKEELKRKWAIPDDFTILNAPKVNPEILILLSNIESTHDSIFSHIQTEIGLGLSTLGSALNKILDNDLNNVKEDILPGLLDSAKYMAQAHFLLTQHRKHQIYPKLNVSMQQVARQCQSDNFLFSKDFAEKCKSATNIKKSSMEMRQSIKDLKIQPIKSKNNLNWKHQFTKTRFKMQGQKFVKGQKRRGQQDRLQWNQKRRDWNQMGQYNNR